MSASDPPAARFRSWAATHAGSVRPHNEDHFVNRPDLGLWAVADGAGGHEAGEVASGTIAQLLEGIPGELSGIRVLAEVRQRLTEAHWVLRREANQRGEGAVVASTVVVLLARDAHFACLWAGDSRAYLMRGGALTQVTRDHSLLQELLDSGTITPAEAANHPQANVITRAVGADADGLELDKVTGELLPGDRFLLCSDGLCKVLDDAQLKELMAAPDGVPPSELLVSAALAQRATDNITAVAIEVTG
jgi:serine/threonine-protein phosphatase Stp1